MCLGIMEADNKTMAGRALGAAKHRTANKFGICNLKVRYSALISQTEGKLNGSKFYSSKGNQIISNKVKPKNRNTSLQAIVRAGLRYYASAWQTLTQAQIATWNAAGRELSIKNKLGTSSSRSGINYFVAENQRNQSANPGAALVTAPYAEGITITPLDCAGPTAAGGATPVMTLDLPAIPTNQVIIVYATAPLSPGKTFVKGLYRQIYVAPTGAAAPGFNLLPAYQAVFGNPVTGKKIFFQWETVGLNQSKIDKLYGSLSLNIIAV